jgi:trk system potassium uptake protein TrkA
MNVVIVGLSRFGLQCAKLLQQQNHHVAVIDRRQEAFNRLPASCEAVLGMGIDQDVMRKAGTDQADLFIAATNDDNTNLMAAQVAKVVFNVKRCIARVRDEGRGQVFHEQGLIEVICPTLMAAKTVANSVK